jgi:hypothetical protein
LKDAFNSWFEGEEGALLARLRINTFNLESKGKTKFVRKLLFTHVIGLKNTSKIPKCPSVINCREKIKLAAVNYRGKPRHLTVEAIFKKKTLSALKYRGA